MEGIPNENRKAYFECSIAAIRDDGKIFSTQGSFTAIYLYNQLAATGLDTILYFICLRVVPVAQLDSYKKNRISHRAKAIRVLPKLLKITWVDIMVYVQKCDTYDYE